MLNIVSHELYQTGKARITSDDCFAALERTYKRCKGSWACTAMLAGFGIIAFRDAYGIRPLCLGYRDSDRQGEKDYMIASESVALNFFGARTADIDDILPGQGVIVSCVYAISDKEEYEFFFREISKFVNEDELTLVLHKIEKGKAPVFHQIQPQKAYAPDIFEFVYFARPDSVIDGISVYASRRNMGSSLAKTIKAQLTEDELNEIDAVIPIPETSNVSARCVAQYLQKELVDGFIKNRYVFRTFILPTQKMRRTGVRRKLNAITSEFEGKTVLLIDDSIVRGTTSKAIVSMAREAGARKVIFASCAPPITHAHIYGIDLASQSELIAHHKSEIQIASAIGADKIVYQVLPDLQEACARASPRKEQAFEVGVFCGQYVTPIEDGYLEGLEYTRNGNKRLKIQDYKSQMANDGIENSLEIKTSATGQTVGTFADSNGLEVERATNAQDLGLYNLNDATRQ